ncbi:MAG TPA: apolipoprotein N-acyltransferase [Spongiibacteraceae bacterium]
MPAQFSSLYLHVNRLLVGRGGDLIAALSGALITLSLAPFNCWPVGIIALALLHRLLDQLSPARAAWRGWCFGAGLFISGASWLYVSIHDFGGASLFLAAFLSGGFCLLLALMHAMLGYGYARWIRTIPLGRWLGFAAWWILWEWVRYWLLTGFPWLYVGYAHLTTPLSGWAPVGGVYAIGFIVALSAAAFSLLPERKFIAALIAIALWLGGYALQAVHWTQARGAPISVALVQANIPQSVKWDPDNFRNTLSLYRSMSAPLWRDNQIVFWPEAAVPTFYGNAKPFFDESAEQANRYGHVLISGVPYRSETNEVFNSAIALGSGSGIYHKQHLVPFGEYVPFEKYLRGLIEFLDLPMSDFQAGPARQAPLHAAGLTFAPFICYEVVYGDLVRHARADVLLTLTNDAWFGHSIGPLQHLQMVQMRSLELGRFTVRVAGNGVTALIDERGRITARIPQFERAVLTGNIQGFTGLTPFARFGSWPVLILCGLVLASGLWHRILPR